jgi:glucokinase
MYASGRALAREGRDLAAQSPMAAERMLALAGSPDAIDGPIVTAAAAEGDPAATSICTTMGRWLGRGLANLAAALDPSVFVIGGGVSAAGELLLRPAREEFAHTLTGRGFRTQARIAAAAFGPDAGLVGAADLARRRLG